MSSGQLTPPPPQTNSRSAACVWNIVDYGDSLLNPQRTKGGSQYAPKNMPCAEAGAQVPPPARSWPLPMKNTFPTRYPLLHSLRMIHLPRAFVTRIRPSPAMLRRSNWGFGFCINYRGCDFCDFRCTATSKKRPKSVIPAIPAILLHLRNISAIPAKPAMTPRSQ